MCQVKALSCVHNCLQLLPEEQRFFIWPYNVEEEEQLHAGATPAIEAEPNDSDSGMAVEAEANGSQGQGEGEPGQKRAKRKRVCVITAREIGRELTYAIVSRTYHTYAGAGAQPLRPLQLTMAQIMPGKGEAKALKKLQKQVGERSMWVGG